jgi:hypothetical protein
MPLAEEITKFSQVVGSNAPEVGGFTIGWYRKEAQIKAIALRLAEMASFLPHDQQQEYNSLIQQLMK